ncbi:HAD family hydrolase [Hoyosella rhizosphaerae]|uniref:Hydrolase n=1 Tax=Hoyosella rhizosphaerae TaxID=1755582 RepID=A0A916U912_9ACTN|nr:HAD family hydrolase [Hoyosella rhizosphaerae]MBN4927398.1 HAD family hydrolase [Hoyosella rhizosphaerae]GGC64731.1 putative hydrolase [Hoyosella rhizosphaerae]
MTDSSQFLLPRPAFVCSDVDGTLINDHDAVSARTKAAIENLTSDGAHFVLATGRPPRWIDPITSQLGHAPLAVCANGAVIYDSNSDKVLHSESLSVETLVALADLVRRTLPGSGLAAERVGQSAHDAATPQFVSSPGYKHAWLNPDHVELSVEEVLAAPAIKLLVRHGGMSSTHMRNVLAPLVGELAHITFSTDKGLVELSAPGITKASGLAWVTQHLNSAPHHAVAFGDMPNDIAMLEWAGHGVAMGNAHPEARDSANEVTSSNNDDGVAVVLERWWL